MHKCKYCPFLSARYRDLYSHISEKCKYTKNGLKSYSCKYCTFKTLHYDIFNSHIHGFMCGPNKR